MTLKKIFVGIIYLIMLTAFVADNDTLLRIGSSLDKMKESAFYAIQQDQFNLFTGGYDAGLCKNIPAAERAALVTSVGNIIKKYAMSPAFMADYERKTKEGYTNEPKPDFAESRWQERIREKETSNEQMLNMLDDTSVKNMFTAAFDLNKMINDAFESKDPDKVAAFTGIGASADESKANMKELNTLADLSEKDKKAFKKGYAHYLAQTEVKNEFKSELDSYKSSVEEQNSKLALNKNDQLKKILQNFLDTSAGIDFTAKLLPADKYGIRKFVNADYESKPSEWKAYYRAGKAPVDAARAFAKQWLSELY